MQSKNQAKKTPLKARGSLDGLLAEAQASPESPFLGQTAGAASEAGAMTVMLGARAGDEDLESELSESVDEAHANADIMTLIRECKLYSRVVRKMKRGHKIKKVRDKALRMPETEPNREYGLRFARLASRLQEILFSGTKKISGGEVDECFEWLEAEKPCEFEYPDVLLKVAFDHCIDKWGKDADRFSLANRNYMLKLATMWADERVVDVEDDQEKVNSNFTE